MTVNLVLNFLTSWHHLDDGKSMEIPSYEKYFESFLQQCNRKYLVCDDAYFYKISLVGWLLCYSFSISIICINRW